MAEKVSLSEWNVPLKNGGDDLLQKYDYFSFLRKDFPLKGVSPTFCTKVTLR